MKKIRFDQIIIPKGYAKSKPRDEKIIECRNAFHNEKRMDRWIVVNNQNILIDGYVMYLVLKEAQYTGYLYVQQSEKKTKRYNTKMNGTLDSNEIYIVGVHPGNNKKYIWKVPKDKKNNFAYKIGDKIMVNTSKGVNPVYIKDIIMNGNSIMPISNIIKEIII